MEKKKVLSLLGEKLSKTELKKVVGGVQYQIDCCRMRKSDRACYFFTTESTSVRDSWQNVWDANDDWIAACKTNVIIQEVADFVLC